MDTVVTPPNARALGARLTGRAGVARRSCWWTARRRIVRHQTCVREGLRREPEISDVKASAARGRKGGVMKDSTRPRLIRPLKGTLGAMLLKGRLYAFFPARSRENAPLLRTYAADLLPCLFDSMPTLRGPRCGAAALNPDVAHVLERFIRQEAVRHGSRVLSWGSCPITSSDRAVAPVIDIPASFKGLKGASARIANRDGLMPRARLRWADGYICGLERPSARGRTAVRAAPRRSITSIWRSVLRPHGAERPFGDV